jgi:ATP-independent RNA helicase DbpA
MNKTMIDTSKILEKMHISELNAMQQETRDVILHSNRDVVILSPTGSGKTLAYLLPLIQLLDGSKDDVQVVVIVPGRELALQSMTVLQNMGSGIRSYACYGGRSTMDEHKILRQVQPQIVFATPGRLNDHLDKGNIAADTIKYLVIDEFDKCLEMGFSDEMSAILDKLPALERRVLLSATDAESIPQFVNMGRTQRVDFLASDEQVPDRVTIYKVISPEKDKLNTLSRLLRSLGDESSIVFLNYRDSVERTDEFLRSKGFSTSAFHGGMEQKQREDALYKFSNGSANIFVSTDLASRGLDIPDIDNIIHYHLPESEDGYIHRVGRTARWDKQGRTFFILGQQEQIPEYVEADIDTYDIPDELPAPSLPKMCTLYIGKGKKDKISKGDIVGFLCKQGKVESSDIGRIDVKDRYAYAAIKYDKFQQVLRLTNGEKIKGIRTVTESVK